MAKDDIFSKDDVKRMSKDDILSLVVVNTPVTLHWSFDSVEFVRPKKFCATNWRLRCHLPFCFLISQLKTFRHVLESDRSPQLLCFWMVTIPGILFCLHSKSSWPLNYGSSLLVNSGLLWMTRLTNKPRLLGPNRRLLSEEVTWFFYRSQNSKLHHDVTVLNSQLLKFVKHPQKKFCEQFTTSTYLIFWLLDSTFKEIQVGFRGSREVLTLLLSIAQKVTFSTSWYEIFTPFWLQYVVNRFPCSRLFTQ